MSAADTALFDLDDTEVWQPIYRDQPGTECRDCGRSKFAWEHGCGGADRRGCYDLCDDCASLDGRGQRGDDARDCSRWGIRSTDDEAARLHELQHQRRAKWMRAHR
jgi:hypothetical protein